MKSQTTIVFCLLMVLIFVNPSSCDAQWNKGDWMVEGSIGNASFSSNKLNNSVSGYQISFNLSPKFGYFITKDLVLGLVPQVNINFYNSGKHTFGGSGQKNQYVSSRIAGNISPFVRYYLPSSNTRNRFYFQLFGGTGINFIQKDSWAAYDVDGTKLESTNRIYSTKSTGFGAGLDFGFQHFISSDIAFNTSIGYNYSKSKQSYYDKATAIDGSTSVSRTVSQIYNYNYISWNLGFTLILPAKKK